MKKFPKLIYVTRENGGSDDEYLSVRPDGEGDTDFTETTPVAIYKLIDSGKIVVSRKYTSGGKA